MKQDLQGENGKRVWIFPDGELPPPGDFPMQGHESLIVLNCNDAPAHAKLSFYFTDREPIMDIPVEIAARRVRCFRLNRPHDIGGVVIPEEVQYAMRLESDVEVVAQYGRLDTRDQPIAFYTVMGYCH